jgi:hypothetical protein
MNGGRAVVFVAAPSERVTDRKKRWQTKETIVRGGIEGSAGRGAGGAKRTVAGRSNTRWQREDLESMAGNRKWAGAGEGDCEGVRAQLLAQKAIYESESQGWRHPLSRLAAIFGSGFASSVVSGFVSGVVSGLVSGFVSTLGGWRRKLWRH